MRVGERFIYHHGMLDRLFTVEITKVTKARVCFRILDGQCRLTDQVERARSLTIRQAREALS